MSELRSSASPPLRPRLPSYFLILTNVWSFRWSSFFGEGLSSSENRLKKQIPRPSLVRQSPFSQFTTSKLDRENKNAVEISVLPKIIRRFCQDWMSVRCKGPSAQLPSSHVVGHAVMLISDHPPGLPVHGKRNRQTACCTALCSLPTSPTWMKCARFAKLGKNFICFLWW